MSTVTTREQVLDRARAGGTVAAIAADFPDPAVARRLLFELHASKALTLTLPKEATVITVPRAELAAVAKRHGVDYDVNDDPSVTWVRNLADGLRKAVAADLGGFAPHVVLAEADGLDALVDRIEAQHANATWLSTDGVSP